MDCKPKEQIRHGPRLHFGRSDLCAIKSAVIALWIRLFVSSAVKKIRRARRLSTCKIRHIGNSGKGLAVRPARHLEERELKVEGRGDRGNVSTLTPPLSVLAIKYR